MFRALRNAWRNYVAAIPPSEIVDSIPPSQWDQVDLLPTVSKAKRKAFADLLSLIYANLPAEVSVKLLADRAKLLIRGDDADTALHAALFPNEDDAAPGNHGFIACDWKATEEIEWQAARLCKAHGVLARWQAPEGTVTTALQAFEEWLTSYNLQLLCFSVGDSVVAFAVPTEDAKSAVAHGKKLKIRLGSASET